MQEVIELVNKTFELDLKLKDYEKFEILKELKTNRFGEFLKDARVKLFILLQLAEQIGFDAEYIIASDEYRIIPYDDGINEPDPPEEYGAVIIKKKYSGKEVFNFFLSSLGLLQVVIQKCFDPHTEAWFTKKGPAPLGEEHITFEETGELKFILSDGQIIMSKSEILIKKGSDYQELLEQIPIQYWENFLKQYSNANGVGHGLYVDFLLKMFPGKIQIRQLS